LIAAIVEFKKTIKKPHNSKIKIKKFKLRTLKKRLLSKLSANAFANVLGYLLMIIGDLITTH
jgi:hypothetical protein